MNCILLWSLINLFLYKCPKSIDIDTTGKNCTQVHQGTYDQEIMLMCTLPIGKSATTTPEPTESYTTLPPVSTTSVSTSTAPLPVETHAPTEPPEYLTTTTSSNLRKTTTSSYIPKTTSEAIHIQSTTISPTTNPPSDQPTFETTTGAYIRRNDTKSIVLTNSKQPIQQTIIQQTSPDTIPILISALSISIVSFIGCIVFGIWSYKKHQEHKVRKMVRPSGVQIEMSPTATQPMLQAPKQDPKKEQRINQLKRMNDGSKTARAVAPKAMMKRSPSQVKKMTLEDWKQLRNELKNPTVIKKPPVNRGNKPSMRPQRVPPAPVKEIKPMAAVVNNNSYVKKMVEKLNKK